MIRLGRPDRDVRTACLLSGVLAALVFFNSLPNQFAYDDVHIIERNTAIQSWETLPDALVTPYWPIAAGPELGLWRPVTTALLGVQYILTDGAPWLFHVVNVLMHVGATILAVLLMAELLTVPAALAGGLIFAVHPVHVEAVANVVGLSEIVSTVALLLACLVHVRSGPTSGWGRSATIGLLYLVGFGAKESGVTLPGLILLLDAARGTLGFRELPAYLKARWRVYAVMLLVAVSLLAARYEILGSLASAYAPSGAQILEEMPRIWTLGTIWLHYVRLWVFPLDLSADYSPNVIPIAHGWGLENTVGALLALVILGVTLLAWRRPAMSRGVETARAAAFGVVWFIIAISPTSNTLFLSGVLLAERTFYLPSVGLAAATGWMVVRLARERPRGAWVVLVVAVVASSVRTWTRNPSWYDLTSVFTTMIRDVPHSGRSQWVLGDQFLLAGNSSAAFRSYRAAISLLDTSYHLLTEMSQRLIDHGYNRGAENLLSFAIRDHPDFSSAYRMMSASRAEQGDAEGAERWARQALARQRAGVDPARHHLLAWALAAQGRMDEAAEERRRGEEIGGRAVFWQGFAYEAYALRAAGDVRAAEAKLDTAWLVVRTEAGRVALDSVRVTEFGLESLRVEPAEPEIGAPAP